MRRSICNFQKFDMLNDVKECRSVGWDQICRTGSNEVEISDKDKVSDKSK
jgi:hypothetical protein